MKSLVVVILLFVVSLPMCAQEAAIDVPFPTEPKGFGFKWDRVQNALIFFRDVDNAETPASRVYANGQLSQFTTFPLRDFPEAKQVTIWDAAAANDGGTVLSVVVDYGSNRTKLLILTYDSGGVLRKAWDVYPYHFHAIAVDRDGNVYGFGEQVNLRDKRDYPLLIKYSPDGRVEMEGLKAHSFLSLKDEVTSNGPASGEHQMFITNGELTLYAAPARELFTFDSSLNLRKRVSISRLLDEVAAESGSGTAHIASLGRLPTGDFLAQLRLFPKNPDTVIASTAMIQLSSDTSSWKRMKSRTRGDWPGVFLGINDAGKCAFLNGAGNGKTTLGFYDDIP